MGTSTMNLTRMTRKLVIAKHLDEAFAIEAAPHYLEEKCYCVFWIHLAHNWILMHWAYMAVKSSP